MADAITQSGALPSIGYIDIEKIKRENTAYNPNIAVTSTLNMPAPPLVSPSSTYSGPPPPYSYPSSAASSVIGGGPPGHSAGPGGYISPPETRRTSGDEKEAPVLPRQSLPSITEALGGDQPLSISSLLSPTNAPPQQRAPLVSQSPTSPIARSYFEPASRGPLESLSQNTASTNRLAESLERSSRSMYTPAIPTAHGETRFPAINTFSAMNSYKPHQPISLPRTASSPSAYTRPALSPIQIHPSQHRPLSPPLNNSITRAPASTSASFSHNTYQPAYSYSPPTPSVPSYRTPISQQPVWRSSENRHVEEIRKAQPKESPSPRPAYGESVKRHLDIFDLESSLNEIAEGSGRALEFSRDFGRSAHQTQRSGPIPGSLPTLEECEEMMKEQNRVLDAMASIRDVIVKQQQVLAEQRNYNQQNYKPPASEADSDANSYMDKLEGSGGFAGSDSKKRRGRAAPPGRCHSCNRAETPEWRRGPDGARTLCNACGLHYAKLTRKMGSKAPTGPTNLRPKESSPQSP